MGLRSLIFAALALTSACTITMPEPDRATQDGADSDPSNTLTRYVADTFINDVIDASCDWVERCGDQFGDTFATRQDCVSIYSFILRSNFVELGDVEDPLLFRLDANSAATCVTSIRDSACAIAPQVDAIPACRAAVVGRLADGDCCDDRGGCGPGLVCETDYQGVGYCSAIGELGESCFLQSCVEGATCVHGESGPQCLRSLELGVEEPCELTFDCAAGLSCQHLGERSVCLTRPALGQPCYGDERPCMDGLYCTGPTFSVCSTTQGNEGDACSAHLDCVSPLDCYNYVCTALPTEDEACLPNVGNVEQRCDTGLLCTNDDVCIAVPTPTEIGDVCHPDGAPCPGDLGFDTCVEREDGYRCAAIGKAGDACSGPTGAVCSISQGLLCGEDGTCQSLPTLGETCEAICHSMFALYCDPVDATCKPRKADGAACTPMGDEDEKNFLFTECSIGAVCWPNEDETTTCRRAESFSGDRVCQ